MKAAFALLADREIHNQVRKLAWSIHRKYHTGIDICQIPPHVSLKQPFNISNLEFLEEYMLELTGSISPFEINLIGLDLIETEISGSKTGILWLDVQESKILRGLHERINQELTERFGDVAAPFDGLEYHFHMTMAMGGQPLEIYKKIYDELSNQLKGLSYVAREMSLFVYDAIDEINAGYITYKILPLGDSRK